MKLAPRETVIMAEDYDKVVAWYRDVLGMKVVAEHTDGYHYTNLENDAGLKIGIAVASEMEVQPGDRTKNTVILQFAVPDVKALFEHLTSNGIKTTFGPSFAEKGQFWYGAFPDVEGNPCWVVDENCP